MASKRPKFHVVADIFPLMDGAELDALADDIRKNGQRVPIILHPDGSILDGRNRWLACEKADVEPKTSTWRGKAETEMAFVLSMNLERRHLTASQRSMIGALRVLPLAQEAAKERQVEGQKTGRASRHGKLDGGKNSTNQVDRHKARDEAAAAVRVNPRYIDMAVKVAETDPDLAKEVESGQKSLSEARRELKAREQDQRRKENRRKVAKSKTPDALEGVFSTIMLDPPWDYTEEGDVNVYGRTKPQYALMGIDEIEKLPVAKVSDSNAHIYLWITNRSMPKGFRLLDAWGFRFITIITWCKPSIGVGNYYRNNTEHILFGVKGKLSLLRNDVGTWFQAKRGPKGHSSKPAESYDLIESCSPGPYVEFFARSKRPNWTAWGAEADE